MSDAVFPLAETRQLFTDAIPPDLFAMGLPELRYLYVPVSHFRALHPDNMLVEGMRGAGKTLWWNALQDEAHRRLIQAVLPRTELAKAECLAGFGVSKSSNYPSALILQDLQQKYAAFDIWYTIVAWNLLRAELVMLETWEARVIWVRDNLERVENQLLQKDQILQAQQKIQMVLFDGLDRAAQDWQALRNLLKGLLRLLLEFRAYRAIRLKAFIRPDMLEDKAILAFPDSSKVLQNKVTLEWPKIDLYNLLWQYLGNEPAYGQNFRQACATHFSQTWQEYQSDIWQIPEAMRTDETMQRKIFHALAGEWMGNDSRRGFPYTWLPNHLGDSYGKVSPRSFLAALRTSALESEKERKDQKSPLHYEAIKVGVSKASTIRVNELAEDYPWVGLLLAPLKGMSLPCEFSLMEDRWIQAKTQLQQTTEITDKITDDARRLPARLDEGTEGIKQDLVELGIFQIKSDNRIDMPDVYRVGYGLGRRGGIKPVR